MPKVTFEQAQAFAEVCLGTMNEHHPDLVGDEKSPLVHAHLAAAIGTLPYPHMFEIHRSTNSWTKQNGSKREPISRAFIEYLEAVADALKWPGYESQIASSREIEENK